MEANLAYGRLAQAAEWSLLAIVVLLHIAGWVWLDKLADVGQLGALLADSLPFATVILSAAWIGVGPGPLWLRGVGLGLLMLGAFEFFRGYGPTNWTNTDRLLAYSAYSVLIVAIGLRFFGLQVVHCEANRTHDGRTTFSVRSLFAITTAIAVVIGGLEAARPWLVEFPKPAISEEELDAILGPITPPTSPTNPARVAIPISQSVLTIPGSTPWNVVEAKLLAAQREGQLRIALAGALFTAISLLAVAAILRPGAIWLRVAAVAISVPAAGWYIGHLTDANTESTVTLTYWVAAIVALVASSLVPLRIMGYRLGRSPTLRVGQAAEKSITQSQQPLADSESNKCLAPTECGPTLKPEEIRT